MNHTGHLSHQGEGFFIDPFIEGLSRAFGVQIQKHLQVEVSVYDIAYHLSSPPKEEWGHYSLPCFFLSQQLNKNPVELAQLIASGFNDSPVFEKVSHKGPYVNGFVRPEFITSQLLSFLNKEGAFQSEPKKTGPLLIEYSQPNTHKDLHVGHLRNLCFGLSLVTLLKKRGWPVITCTYPGDMGAHIAKCLWYLVHHNKEPQPAHNKGEWLGALYTKACQKYEQAENTAEQEQNKAQLTHILRQLRDKKGKIYDLWKETRLWSQELMDKLYQWMGARFDHWYWESEMDQPSIEWVNKLYKRGQLSLSKGALGMDLGPDLGFCLLLKSDGQGLYATKDLYLMARKFEDHQVAKNIYIVDQRQETHFKQIFKVMAQIGHKEWAGKSFHLKYNFVELKSGVMSSRAGNIVPVMSLINNMTHYIESTFLKKYKAKWPEKKIKHIAYVIAQGAIKYGMNDQDLNKKIIFDWEEWLRTDGRSGPYIQYAHARASTLLKKFEPVSLKDIKPLITSLEEWRLLLHLSWFFLVMEKSAFQMKTTPICHYLFELAQKFSRFYQNCPISGADSLNQKRFRLFLVQTSKKVLAEGLAVLSIPAPEQM